MQNILKILLILTFALKFSNCVTYDDSSDENVAEKTTVNDNDTTVSDEVTDEVTNKGNTRRELFDYEDKNTEKQTAYTNKPNILDSIERMLELTTRTWVKEPIESNTSNKHRADIKEACPQIKFDVTDFNYNDMADTWQVVYYQTNEKVQCFKIHVRKLSKAEKTELGKKFGTFNGKVHWEDCNLEIRSSAHTQRTHYLQGTNEDNGVMDNIIIRVAERNNEKGDTSLTPSLHDEVPDQWMVTKKLLLMRDCETGNTVVFSRVPFQPVIGDILEALKDFGEEDKNGKMACVDEEIIKPFDTDDDGATSFD